MSLSIKTPKYFPVNTILIVNYLLILLLFVVLTGCSSTQLVNQWKNPNIESFEASKILVVGMTSNKSARKKFEKKLKEEYLARGIEAVGSLELFEKSFTQEKRSEEELSQIENILLEQGFNSILFTKVMGVEDRITFSEEYGDFDNTARDFKDDYYINQDIYYNRKYYDKFKVYHAETALYCICSEKERDLIWKGYIDIIDPSSVKETVDDYINLVLYILEEQHLLQPLVDSTTEEVYN